MTPQSETPSWQELDEPRLVDTCEQQPVYLLTGRNGSRIRLSESARQLLRLRGAGVTPDAIAEALGRQGRTISAEEVETRYRDLLQRIERIEDTARDNPMGFWFRIPLLPEALVARLAGLFHGAFERGRAMALLAVIALGLAVLIADHPRLGGGSSAFWLGYGLFLISLVFHELGHASACAHFGVRPGEIGATLYLIYPALYSNVSAAWSLPRRQRVVVDLGGVYFQLLAGAVYVAAFSLSGWEPLRVAVVMILGTVVFSLNPIFKFDGYWVVADSLGVTNLGRQPSRILGSYVRRLRGLPAERLPWSGRTTATLAVYSVLSFVVWGWFLSRLGPRLWSMIASLGPQVAGLLRGSPDVKPGALLASVFMTGLMLFISVRLVRSMIVGPLVSAVRRWRQRRSRGAMVPKEVS